MIVPYLRGFGTTRFLSDETVRNGEQAALALDTIALMDALGIETAVVAGFDWGARRADIVAALWPERCRGLVSVSGYLIGSQAAGKLPLPPEAELQWWYQFYFATERGRAGYDRYRREFAKLIWRTASPRWEFDDATFERSDGRGRCPGRGHRASRPPARAPLLQCRRRSTQPRTATPADWRSRAVPERPGPARPDGSAFVRRRKRRVSRQSGARFWGDCARRCTTLGERRRPAVFTVCLQPEECGASDLVAVFRTRTRGARC